VIFRIDDGERVVSVARLPDDTEDNGDAAAESAPGDAPINEDQQTDTGDQ
jgi:hypothetical protein